MTFQPRRFPRWLQHPRLLAGVAGNVKTLTSESLHGIEIKMIGHPANLEMASISETAVVEENKDVTYQ
jgi:hypothetical protein